MAWVIIDGEEEKQEENVSFQDFIVSYPGCYLRRDDSVAIRKPATVLETNRKYTLIRPVGATSFAKSSVLDVEQLVIKGGMNKALVQEAVIARMIERFAPKVNIALFTQNAQLAKTIYDDVVEMPLTTTCRELSTAYDIIVDGCVYGDNIHLQICFMDGKPSVLKTVTYSEYERAKALVAAKVKHPHLVELLPISLERKLFVVMPLLPITVVSLSGIPERKAVELWDQIGSGLECLHTHGFAHKDVKSDNICVDSNGNFVLIDMGDTVPFGQRSGSTAQYVPSDLDGAAPATELLDWGMLAMTIYDRMQPQGEGVSFRECEMSTDDLLSWFRLKNFTALYDKIQTKFRATEEKGPSGVSAKPKG